MRCPARCTLGRKGRRHTRSVGVAYNYRVRPGAKTRLRNQLRRSVRPSVRATVRELEMEMFRPKKRRRCASVVRANFSCRRPSVRPSLSSMSSFECRFCDFPGAPNEGGSNVSGWSDIAIHLRRDSKSEGSAVCAARQEGLIQSTGSVFPKLIGMSYRTGKYPSYRLHFHSMQLRCCRRTAPRRARERSPASSCRR